MSQNELTAIIREIKEYQIMADEIAATLEDLKDKVKAVMQEQNTDEMTVDVFKVRWTPVVSKRFDTTGFKSTHADLYGQYCKETVSRRFTVA